MANKNLLTEAIIKAILASPLNIPQLDDDVEAELYRTIFEVVKEHTPSLWDLIKSKIKSLFSR